MSVLLEFSFQIDQVRMFKMKTIIIIISDTIEKL